VRKLRSYVRRANVPLPERLESYNFIYRQPLGEMFAGDFLAEVDVHVPSALLEDAYDRADMSHFINRILHLDLKVTLADNDLRKVNGMAEAAGIEVRYGLGHNAGHGQRCICVGCGEARTASLRRVAFDAVRFAHHILHQRPRTT